MKVTILYGSATGNAEHIAKDLANSINESKCDPPTAFFASADVMELNHFKRKKVMEGWVNPPSPSPSSFAEDGAKKHALIVVTSTTGNGEPPENAGRFVRFLKKAPPAALTDLNPALSDGAKPLEHVAYAVLALGDTNYDQFCETGRVIDKRLSDWGATRGVPTACADEGTGLEGTVEPWLETVLGGLEKACKARDEEEKKEDKGVEEKLEKLAVSEEKKVEVPKSTNATTETAAETIPSAPASNVPLPDKSPTPLYILYGSATGNAEHIAKDLAATYELYLQNPSFLSYFTSVVCCDLNGFRKKGLPAWTERPHANPNVKHGVIMVCSTTGNADAPENADRFVRWMKRKATEPLQPFEHCAYAVLGLGDTNYDVFCATGKQIDRKLVELGGTRAAKGVWCDEAVGLEQTVEPWVGSVISKVAAVCKGETAAKAVAVPKKVKDPSPAEEKKMEAEETDAPVEKKIDAPPSTSVTTTTTPTAALAAPPTESPTPLYVLYGSATGNAEHIAKDLAASYESHLTNPSFAGYFSSVLCCELNAYKKKCLDSWTKQPHENASVKHGVIIVCSTTGNADAPENADRFFRWMKRKTTGPTTFQHCAYAVLGLGDTNYDVFNAMGKAIDKRLSDLGGTRAMKAAYADEAVGLEQTVEPWVASVIGKLADVCKGEQAVSVGVKTTKVEPAAAAAPTTAAVPKKLKKSSSSSMEEKKMEVEETVTLANFQPSSAGVSTIRKLLALTGGAPIPTVEHTSLPKMVSRLSSCELITEETRRRSRGDSLADNMTVSSGSSGFLYTATNPYESKVLDARYLTNTDVLCAKTVAKEVLKEGGDEEIVKAMKLYQEHFPLSGDQPQLQYDKNGKRVMEMTLSLPDDFTLEYEPGDSVGLIVPNSPQSTSFILNMLERTHGIMPSQKISVDAAHPITVEEAIKTTIDLCSPMKKKRLLLLSMFATDPEEERAMRMLSSNGKEDLFQKYVEDQHRTIVDILKEFPSCQSISLEGLLGCLPAIPPRYYSVCSSPLAGQQQPNGDREFYLKVAFSVVDYLTPSLAEDANSGRRMGGLATGRMETVCSPFLSNHASSSSNRPILQIFPKPTHEFRLPSSQSTPLILIGPGTGIAPFIGFLSHRAAQLASLDSLQSAEMTSEGTWRGGYELEPDDLALSKGDVKGLNPALDYVSKHQQLGDIDLFFGCRNEEHDYLYRKELEDFKKDGIVTNLYAAFSRDEGKKKMYVQTLMQEDAAVGKRLVEMIMKKEASVYICGDGNAMGRDVQETIVNLLAEHHYAGDKDCKSKAVAQVDQMKTHGRFVLDIWS